jgi:hypothetical protein
MVYLQVQSAVLLFAIGRASDGSHGSVLGGQQHVFLAAIVDLGT